MRHGAARRLDGRGAVVTRDVTITITGANDAPVITGAIGDTVVEDSTIAHVGRGVVTFSDVDLSDTHTA